MSRDIEKRLRRLEATSARESDGWNWERPAHVLICDGEDPEAKVAELIASGEAQEGDRFIVHVIVDPPARETRQ